ncbi:MAG: 16S rRNA (adenine(1518)-N(6)/adenine(1519)-N(6))-dimethyltransferase RsmA [Thermoanaerobaculia bacterium]
MRRPPKAGRGPRLRSGRNQDRPPLRKALGQHHLRSGATCRPLLEFLQPAGRTTVEIGPGGGVLTTELLEAGARVLALELDPAWADELRVRLLSAELEIRVADALEFDWDAVPANSLVTGNLPYNVGTAIVERVLRSRAVARAGFLLQREVVDRLVAPPGDPAYGALSVRVALRAEARRLGAVRRGSFVPPPKVDSAFVGFLPRPAPAPLADGVEPRFESFVQEAFAMRRKTLVNCLAASFEREAVEEALRRLGRPPATRAEVLSLDELVALFVALEAPRGGPPSRSGGPPSGTISDRGNEPNH